MYALLCIQTHVIAKPALGSKQTTTKHNSERPQYSKDIRLPSRVCW